MGPAEDAGVSDPAAVSELGISQSETLVTRTFSGFAFKAVRRRTWISVSTTCGSGWVDAEQGYSYLGFEFRMVGPPATAGGTDIYPTVISDFDAKRSHFRFSVSQVPIISAASKASIIHTRLQPGDLNTKAENRFTGLPFFIRGNR